MFKQAMRLKLRFNYKGVWATEDLWDLGIQELDEIFKKLNSKKKEQSEESLLETKSKEDHVLDLKIKIIKHIVETKVNEQKARENEHSEAARKQKIMKIIANKKDQELKDMTVEDLEKML